MASCGRTKIQQVAVQPVPCTSAPGQPQACTPWLAEHKSLPLRQRVSCRKCPAAAHLACCARHIKLPRRVRSVRRRVVLQFSSRAQAACGPNGQQTSCSSCHSRSGGVLETMKTTSVRAHHPAMHAPPPAPSPCHCSVKRSQSRSAPKGSASTSAFWPSRTSCSAGRYHCRT